MKYSRILLKLSGESLSGSGNLGISDTVLNEYAKQVIDVLNKGCEVANSNRGWKYISWS